MLFSNIPQRRARLTHFLGLALVTLSVGCSNVIASDVAVPVVDSADASGSADASANAVKSNGDTLAAIASQQVIYLGETHTSEADHLAQLELIQALAEEQKAEEQQIVIGLEMFQRPFQPILDRYLAGEISEAELIAQSEYETRWGYDWELYAPIIRYAKDNQIPLIALNTPAEVTRQVAREGLESLSGDALTYIPPIEDIDTTDQAYRDSIAGVFNAHGGAGHSMNFDNFFAAQVLWDETMAEAVVKQLEADPNQQVIVLVGEGHIAYDYGIPNRVERRMPDVAQASVRLIPSEEQAEAGFADYFWMTE
ncbi:MAG: ChaN family lipoprotein [Cyanobacteria bacterium J06621_11]